MTLSDATAGIAPGQIIADKYLVERVIGQGGMGIVVAARHIELDDRVAIKFLSYEVMGNSEAVARFAREARASVKIKSEHVARTLDVGRLDSGAPYMIMEYLEGTDLAARVQQQGPLSVESAIAFMLETCEALAEAHAMGIIHRDLKPSNLFIVRKSDGTESIKLLDFGISKITRGTDSGAGLDMTRTAAIMGSPLYMSPEQLTSSRDVDARTDIWSLGATLFELLTGSPPFTAASIAELGAKVLTYPTPSVRQVRSDVPEMLDFAIQRCLAKSAHDRYANVAEIAAILADYGPQPLRYTAERIARVLGIAGLSSGALQSEPLTDPQLDLSTYSRPDSGNAPLLASAAVPSAPLPRPDPTLVSWEKSKPRLARRKGLVVSGLIVGALLLVMIVMISLKSARNHAPVTVPASADQVASTSNDLTERKPEAPLVAGDAALASASASGAPVDVNSLLTVASSVHRNADVKLAGSVPRRTTKQASTSDHANAANSATVSAPALASPQSSAKPGRSLPEYGGRKY